MRRLLTIAPLDDSVDEQPQGRLPCSSHVL